MILEWIERVENINRGDQLNKGPINVGPVRKFAIVTAVWKLTKKDPLEVRNF